MKKIAFLLALIMTVAAVAMPIGAEDGKKFVMLFDFDNTAEGMTSMTTIDKENNIDGSGCFSCCTTGNTPTISAKFDAVDVSDCDYLAFWLYLEDASLAGKFTYGRIEVTSSGKSGVEDIWYPICKKDNFPDCWLPDLIEGGAKAGWNLVRLPLNVTTGTPTGGQIKVNTNAADRTKINYFRIYGTDSALVSKTIKVDSLFAYQEGATIPEPKKAGTEEPAAKDPVFVKIFDFDTVTATSAGYDLPAIDTENHLNGDGCYTLKTDTNGAHPNIPMLEAKFDPVDISGCDYLCLWLYLESPELATKFASGRIELNSSGTHNESTDLYVVTGNASGYPNSVIANLIEGGAKAGWNLVRIPLNTSLDDSAFKVYHDNADRTKINYFRLQCTSAALAGKTIKLDYMYAYSEGAEVPAPQKNAAPETQAPETQAPETDAPETQAPETDAPETKAPETDAPATQAPATQPAVDPHPATFDATASIAVVTVVAMGIVLVSSKKRH